MGKERIQKIISHAGLGSRREVETWIVEGLVRVNGEQVALGAVASATDQISVRGKVIPNPLKNPLETRVLLYHKPVGEISSRHDPNHPKTVFDKLPRLRLGRWVQVGRLDINTSGLLLFTNNGDLAHCLMHPRFALEREYAVRVRGQMTTEIEKKLLEGVMLEDGKARFNAIQYQGGEGANAWYHVTLAEGRNREVRRLFESQGLVVSRLTRIRFGSIFMPRYLSRGQVTELPSTTVEKLICWAKEQAQT